MQVVYNPAIETFTGRLGNIVFVNRKADGAPQAQARAFVPPSNPQTSNQDVARSNFGQASSAWTAFSAANKAAWQSIAEAYYQEQVNPQTGQLFDYNGQTLYMAACILALEAGASALSSDGGSDPPPSVNGVPVSLAINATTGVMDLTLVSAPANDHNYRLRITEAFTAGYARPLGDLRNPWLYTARDEAIVTEDASINVVQYAGGAALVDLQSEYAALSNGDLIVVEVLAATEDNFLPCPTGPRNEQIVITVT